MLTAIPKEYFPLGGNHFPVHLSDYNPNSVVCGLVFNHAEGNLYIISPHATLPSGSLIRFKVTWISQS